MYPGHSAGSMVGEGLPVNQGGANGGVDGALAEQFRCVPGGVREAVQDSHHAPAGAFEDDRQGAEVETSVQHVEGLSVEVPGRASRGCLPFPNGVPLV